MDIQKILPAGSRDTIRQGARDLCHIFKRELICKNYPGLHGIGVRDEWEDWAYRAQREPGTEDL
jgi:hypothetical protein